MGEVDPQLSEASTLKFFSYLLNMLLDKQQQVIEVTKGETCHLEQFQNKSTHTHLRSFL